MKKPGSLGKRTFPRKFLLKHLQSLINQKSRILGIIKGPFISRIQSGRTFDTILSYTKPFLKDHLEPENPLYRDVYHHILSRDLGVSDLPPLEGNIVDLLWDGYAVEKQTVYLSNYYELANQLLQKSVGKPREPEILSYALKRIFQIDTKEAGNLLDSRLKTMINNSNSLTTKFILEKVPGSYLEDRVFDIFAWAVDNLRKTEIAYQEGKASFFQGRTTMMLGNAIRIMNILIEEGFPEILEKKKRLPRKYATVGKGYNQDRRFLALFGKKHGHPHLGKDFPWVEDRWVQVIIFSRFFRDP